MSFVRQIIAKMRSPATTLVTSTVAGFGLYTGMYAANCTTDALEKLKRQPTEPELRAIMLKQFDEYWHQQLQTTKDVNYSKITRIIQTS